MAVAGDMTVPVCPSRAAFADQGAEAATDEVSEAAHARFVSAGLRTYEAHALKEPSFLISAPPALLAGAEAGREMC